MASIQCKVEPPSGVALTAGVHVCHPLQCHRCESEMESTAEKMDVSTFTRVLELVRCIKYAPMLANFGTGKKRQILPKSRRILQVMEIGCVVVCCLHCYIPRLKKT